ncbi:MAG TPA: PDZ domain-containing protein [Candidatus Enterousia intestinigallinarum]|uniref:PDZ domain-containing protein n=1 Tax=Candidatus Enterousia intestinigallinarum TaxID=2840790 RepID=A0A9D1FHP6_9PROT|nr:PDZ domain-containing protein [Candidatus Enterousia intestinigallinarum]
MKIAKLFLFGFLTLGVTPCFADSLFFEDEPVQDGLKVFDVSATFADIYEKLDGVKWGGKNINVAIESLENLNTNAHIAATDERVVLVWGDAIIANYPRPAPGDWQGFGEITTALVLKLRANDAALHAASESEMYQMVVDSLMRGIDENGRYIYSRRAEITEDGRILTSVGLEGARDARGNWRVTGVFKDSPADTAGLREGDLIVSINGQNVAAMSDAELSAAMSGFNSGTSKIKLLSPGGERDVVLRRATVILADADVVHRSDADTGGILEIVVHKISDNTVSIVNEALAKYQDVSGIILDLRAATGDDERAAAKLAGLFIGKKPVMRIVETARDEVEVIPGGDAVTDAPVVVLMSNMTRGTAEAVVAAFYENERGVLVGTPTAGSARIATRINLENGGALELLNKSIKTGTGRAIDGRGIFPIVCLSNIRSTNQQNAFFLNVINNDFNAQDFNRDDDIDVDAVRRGCPVITSGADEDALSAAVAAKILTDSKLYNKLVAE